MGDNSETSSPLLYEINTRCWIRELSARIGHPVTLQDVPQSAFDQWKRYGFTHIWLMGAWSTGPLARAQALAHSSLHQSYFQALPDWSETDILGSPYAISDYQISEELGGDEALNAFRDKLHEHGIKLLLDFVPNHLGVDHSWLTTQPELFVHSRTRAPETFAQETSVGTFWLAHGKDPYFAAWTDTVQIDYRREKTQAAMLELLRSLATRCDGVRCDMAMLLLGDIFVKTWERFPSHGNATATEFWQAAIPAIKSEHPDFLFLAEAYWGTESRLLSLGFDFTYDKTLYDRLVSRDARGVQEHLLKSPLELITRSAHFLENHDEPRIASIFSSAEHRAAALLVLTLPGMRFLHQGQLTGARRRVPVQLGRCPQEEPQSEVEASYKQILTVLKESGVGRGEARLLEPTPAWSDNPTASNIIVVQWQQSASAFLLSVVNLAPHRSQCYVKLSIQKLPEHEWRMKDLLGTDRYERCGAELFKRGLYLDLPPHGAQLFHFKPL
jgi:hypothetical protein